MSLFGARAIPGNPCTEHTKYNGRRVHCVRVPANHGGYCYSLAHSIIWTPGGKPQNVSTVDPNILNLG